MSVNNGIRQGENATAQDRIRHGESEGDDVSAHS